MPVADSHTALRWDLFCRVVDNYGDLGVTRRVAQHLAALGQCVRLWVDDVPLLQRMAPDLPMADESFWQQGAAGLRWLPWGPLVEAHEQPGDVVVEAFGCDPPATFVQRMTQQATPAVWLNLEYLSAEDYVRRSHGLPSPQSHGAGAGLTKWFFYPGFSADTGGLPREQDLLQRRARFDRRAWLQGWGIEVGPEPVVAVFAYDSAPLEDLLDHGLRHGAAAHVLLTEGRLQARAQAWLRAHPHAADHLKVTALPWLSTEDFDHLLWSADLNFVRGEDSVVRALWAGSPFVWQIYPQDDGVHRQKLDAFWNWMVPSARNGAGAAPDWPAQARAWWDAWNGWGPWPEPAHAARPWPDLMGWSQGVRQAREALLHHKPLALALIEFVAQRRAAG